MHELALMEEVHPSASGGRRRPKGGGGFTREAPGGSAQRRADFSAAFGFAFEVFDGGWNQQRGNGWSWELVPVCVGYRICGENLEPMNVI